MKDPTKEQEKIITASAHERTIVLAGPGTGKTETVARRLAHLVGTEGLRPSQILVLSFSRSAVKALVTRIRDLDQTDTATIEELRFLSVRTFDSWAFRMLRFLGREATDLLRNGFDENIGMLIKSFNDLGVNSALGTPSLRLGTLRHLVVDEFQDLAGVRAELVRELLRILTSENAAQKCGFTILGDSNQAIYDFSLAASEYDGDCATSRDLLMWINDRFQGELKNRKLTKNHRSSSQELSELILEAADVLVDAERGGVDPADELEELLRTHVEAEDQTDLFKSLVGDASDGLAVLCRSNSQIVELSVQMQYLSYKQGQQLRDFYMMAGTPPDRLPPWVAILLHRFTAGSLTKKKFVQIFGIVFPNDADAPCGGDAEAAWRLLLGYAKTGEQETSLDMDDLRKRIKWPDTLPDDEGVSDAGVTFTTIHQAKGLEYRKVRLVKGDDGSTPESVDALEEGRVLFVGMSRAKDDLAVLNFPSTRPFYLRPCADGRERWHRWIFKVTQFELGCSGDINEESILRTDLIGSAEIVKKTQDFLSANQAQLIGRGVTLVKEPVPGKSNRYFYKIMLDPDGKDARCLGYLHEFVTRDILGTRSTKKMWLPNNIHNLRISAVTTSVTNRDLHIKVPAPWRDSKFWLTVIVHGIGQYT